MLRFKCISLGVLAAILLAGSVVWGEEKDPNIAPDFTLKGHDGNDVHLAALKGKIVVLEWFNYECPFVLHHCEKASTMKDLALRYRDKGVVWLAINSTSHQETAKNQEFAKKHKVPYPLLDDRSGTTGKAYGAKTTPQMVVVDKQGRIVYNGAIDNAPMGKVQADQALVNYVDKALAELTSGKTVGTPVTKSYGCSVKYKPAAQ